LTEGVEVDVVVVTNGDDFAVDATSKPINGMKHLHVAIG
jgi:hypothetical protein